MLLSIVIVNFNGAGFLKDTLDAALSSLVTGPFEVIVIDNASTDRSHEILSLYADRVRLVYNPHNLGFAAANNQGVAMAGGTYVFLLNNDTLIPETLCQQLITVCEGTHRGKKVGAVGPRLRHEDGSLQLPGSVLGRYRYRSNIPQEVSFLSGAAVMMSRSLYLSLGGFDEAFFFYNEDIDLCRRIQKAGYALVFFPGVDMVHFGGKSTQFLRKKALIEGYRGGIYFCRKHYGVLAYLVYRVVLVPVVLVLLAYYVLTGWSPIRREQVAAFWSILGIVVKGL